MAPMHFIQLTPGVQSGKDVISQQQQQAPRLSINVRAKDSLTKGNDLADKAAKAAADQMGK